MGMFNHDDVRQILKERDEARTLVDDLADAIGVYFMQDFSASGSGHTALEFMRDKQVEESRANSMASAEDLIQAHRNFRQWMPTTAFKGLSLEFANGRYVDPTAPPSIF
jgi:hypothetical protein